MIYVVVKRGQLDDERLVSVDGYLVALFCHPGTSAIWSISG
jgi:hypothetical protein